MTGWTLLMRYIGQRASLPALLLLPSGIFAVLFVATRAAACIPPRSRLQKTDRIATVSFWSPRAGASTEWRVPLLITVGLLGDMVACGRLNLEVCLALRGLVSPAIVLLGARLGCNAPEPTSARAVAEVSASLLLALSISSVCGDWNEAIVGLAGAVAHALAWCLLASEGVNASSPDRNGFLGEKSPLHVTLYDTAPVGLLLSAALAIAVLLLDLPTYKFFFAPSTIVALGGAASIVGALAVACPLWTLYAAATDTDEDLKPLAIAGGNVYVAGLTVALSYLDRTPEAPTLRVPLAVGLAIALRWCAPGASSNLPLVTSRPSSPVSPAPSYTSSAGQGYSPPSLTGVECDSEQGNYPPSPLSPLSIPPAYASGPNRLSDWEWHSVGRKGHVLAIAPFVSILLLVLQPSFTSFFGSPSNHLRHWAPRLSATNRTCYALGPAPPRVPTLDIVFALYDLDLASFDKHVQHVRGQPALRGYQTRISVYHKGVGAPGATSLEEISKLAGVNEVVPLPNLGREGGTYLHHILRRFEPSAVPGEGERTSHADLTLFLQHHLAWEWIANVRFDFVDPRTGFLSLAPYVESDCGVDLNVGGNFKRVRDIYSMFRENLCPPTHQLTSWAAQMFVSRERIEANPPSKYRRLLDLLEAPAGHWIYEEGTDFKWRGEMSRSNPFLGHAVERSWPIIFNCTDPTLARRCGDNTIDKDGCQCYDDV
ncbi:hypothetical protein BMF94_5480 [Rhodotorula taiwanensis]|uniref:Uncharacterized protein n=1 Tax=Rhodotorula taiwanensis TaxID=741276 RepID=A0A2S5B324_9BASI|nr:hypothetical protein BMF94_5480 [Rhodotorula taiwanensis]